MEVSDRSSVGPAAIKPVVITVDGPSKARILQKWKTRARLACASQCASQSKDSKPNLQNAIVNNEGSTCKFPIDETQNISVDRMVFPSSSMDTTPIINDEALIADIVMGSRTFEGLAPFEC